MKKIFYLALSAALIAGVSGCGDNKTKEKLIGTSIYTSSGGGAGMIVLTPTESTVSMAANSASMAALAGSGTSKMQPAPALNAAMAASKNAMSDLAGLQGPDSDGFFTYPGITGSTMKIQFLTASDTPITNLSLLGGQLAFIRVVLSSSYSFGTFIGDFKMVFNMSNTAEQTVQSGSIVLSNDPAGMGGFTASITGMVVEVVSLNGVTAGLPKSGTMTIASANNAYSGTNTFSKSGSTYLCIGDINAGGVKVAEVHLSYDTAFANYTGYWLDTIANDGVQHSISADIKAR